MPEFHDAGVYLVRNRRNGASYIGASFDLSKRLTLHRDLILAVRKRSLRKKLWRFPGFEECGESDLELRIIERIEIPISEPVKRVRGCSLTPSHRRLLNRERFWIRKLNPSCNRHKYRLPVNTATLPTGLPDDTSELSASSK